MKKIIYIFTLLMILYSCSSEIGESLPEISQQRTYRMYMNGKFTSYDDESGSRASVSLPNGTVMYLTFPNDVKGQAIYSDGAWTVSYSGKLESGNCSAYCFIGSDLDTGDTYVRLKNIPGYGIEEGMCTVASNGDIMLTAELKPLYSRIRFMGAPESVVKSLDLVRVPTGYYFNTRELSYYIPHVYSNATGTDGYTPYLYYSEPEGSDIILNVNGNKFISNQCIPKNIGSYVITLPTETNHIGWDTYNKYTIYDFDDIQKDYDRLEAGVAVGFGEIDNLEDKIKRNNSDFISNENNVYILNYEDDIVDLFRYCASLTAEMQSAKEQEYSSKDEINSRILYFEDFLSALFPLIGKTNDDIFDSALPPSLVYDLQTETVTIDNKSELVYCIDVSLEDAINDNCVWEKYAGPIHVTNSHVIWTKFNSWRDRYVSYISRFNIP